MPAETVVAIVAVLAVFAVFATTLAWVRMRAPGDPIEPGGHDRSPAE